MRARLAGALTASALLVCPPVAGAARTAHAAVVNGTQISVQQAPWQVAVQAQFRVSETLVERVFCSGSIIDSSHILTAAHCVFMAPPNQRIPPEDFTVLAGSSNLKTPEGEEQSRSVTNVRAHPYYTYAPSSVHATPDDVAVLTLSEPLQLGASVSPISLTPLGAYPPEGITALFTGFGEQNSETHELNGLLYSLPLTLAFSRECGGEGGAQNAVLLCAIGPTGSPCEGDSGSALTAPGSVPTQIGVLDDVAVIGGKACTAGSRNVSANVAAPEIQDFIDGSESPPQAPRGGGASCQTVAPAAGSSMTCQAGTWSNDPTFTYVFMNSVSGQVLQSGPSPAYEFSAADVGSSIYMRVLAVNAGGTGVDRTASTTQVMPGPPSRTPSSKFSGHVSLIATAIIVQSRDIAAVKIGCPVQAKACRGTITLTVAVKAADRHPHTVQIGKATFSAKAGRTATVKVKLNATGSRLLASGHGRLSATVEIHQLQPTPKRTLRKSVRLLRKGSAAHRAK